MNTYEIRYTDSRMGSLIVIVIEAKNKDDALDDAYEDYYFGSLISIEEYENDKEE